MLHSGGTGVSVGVGVGVRVAVGDGVRVGPPGVMVGVRVGPPGVMVGVGVVAWEISFDLALSVNAPHPLEKSKPIIFRVALVSTSLGMVQ